VALVERVAPDRAVDLAFRLWTWTGPRPRLHPAAAQVLESAQPLVLPSEGKVLGGFAWGSGPAVLLVHGWGGDSAQLSGFVNPLVEEGHRVVAFDLPAHGRNPGRTTNVFQAAAAVRAAGDAFGPLHAVVGHSFGALASTVAVAQGMPVKRVVSVASPALPEAVLDGFGALMGLSPRIRDGLYRRLERFAGREFWSRLGHPLPALIIHDRDDREIPFRSAEVLASAWPRARLIPTAGLGHNRILRDPHVIAEITRFVAARDGAAGVRAALA
jgi:pimeloyl-ACP methyl ester carboxylesterase